MERMKLMHQYLTTHSHTLLLSLCWFVIQLYYSVFILYDLRKLISFSSVIVLHQKSDRLLGLNKALLYLIGSLLIAKLPLTLIFNLVILLFFYSLPPITHRIS